MDGAYSVFQKIDGTIGQVPTNIFTEHETPKMIYKYGIDVVEASVSKLDKFIFPAIFGLVFIFWIRSDISVSRDGGMGTGTGPENFGFGEIEKDYPDQSGAAGSACAVVASAPKVIPKKYKGGFLRKKYKNPEYVKYELE